MSTTRTILYHGQSRRSERAKGHYGHAAPNDWTSSSLLGSGVQCANILGEFSTAFRELPPQTGMSASTLTPTPKRQRPGAVHELAGLRWALFVRVPRSTATKFCRCQAKTVSAVTI